jgi:hypothetical protein
VSRPVPMGAPKERGEDCHSEPEAPASHQVQSHQSSVIRL